MSESNDAVSVKTFSLGYNKFWLFFFFKAALRALLLVRVNACNSFGIFARLGLSLAKTSVENSRVSQTAPVWCSPVKFH